MLSFLVLKELQQELRSKEAFISMLVFGVTITLLFSFAFNAGSGTFRQFLPGLIWMTFFFIAVLGLLRTFAAERRMAAYHLLLTSPVDRSFIYLAKLFSFWIILTLTQIIILPCFTLFLSLDLSGQWVNVLIILAISNWAIAAVGILIAGICFNTPMGEILLPILLFPILSPVLISAVRLTISMIQNTFVVNNFWFMLILTFSVCFTLAGFLIFNSISQD